MWHMTQRIARKLFFFGCVHDTLLSKHSYGFWGQKLILIFFLLIIYSCIINYIVLTFIYYHSLILSILSLDYCFHLLIQQNYFCNSDLLQNPAKFLIVFLFPSSPSPCFSLSVLFATVHYNRLSQVSCNSFQDLEVLPK